MIGTNSNSDDKITTKENILSPNYPDVGWIPSLVTEYKQSAKALPEEDIKKTTSPKNLSPLQHDFLSVHYKLNHLPFTIMLRLSNMIILPCRFLKLINDLPSCVSCLFGKAHRRPWRHKPSTKSTGVFFEAQTLPSPGSKLAQIRLCRLNQGLFLRRKVK